MADEKAKRKAIVAKLRRLMSMTVENGASEAEAMMAAEKAAALMREHNMHYSGIDELEAETYADDARPWFRGSKGRKRPAPIPVEAACLAAICKLCSVEYAFNTYTGNLTFFGAAHQTEVAHYLVVIISRAIEREWQTLRLKLSISVQREARASFRRAMAYRIAVRLDQMGRISDRAPGSGLVPIIGSLLSERFRRAHPEIRTRREPKLTNEIAAAAGWHAGDRVPLSHGVNEAAGVRAIGSD